MVNTRQAQTIALAAAVGILTACSDTGTSVAPNQDISSTLAREIGAGALTQFVPLPSSAVCTVAGGDAVNPLTLPLGATQWIVAAEPDYDDVPDMLSQNENGDQPGRYLYAAHELGSNGSVSVTDLVTGKTTTIARRSDWEALDPIVWTPWGTLLVAEETNAAVLRDPQYPQAVAGLVYELFPNRQDPTTIDKIEARPAIGSKSHEGMRFDRQGNLYGISERTPGYIFKFVPDRKGDLSSGATYVLRLTTDLGDHTGPAEWVALDRNAVQVDASAAADLVNATGYGRPEDVEIGTSSGASRDGDRTMYVAITSEHRVLAIKLLDTGAIVSNYVKVGLNATSDFFMPDNLALDRSGNLFIAEDPGGSFSGGKTTGDDIWVATPGRGGNGAPATSVMRLASLTDCDAEPTGLYYDLKFERLFVNVQHRGGDHLDKTVAVTRVTATK